MVRIINAITRGIDRLTLSMMRRNLRRQADEDARDGRFRATTRGNEGSGGSDAPG